MKTLIALLSLILFVQVEPANASKDLSPDADLGPTINMSEPPFWMSSYDEFNDLQDDQKELYVKKLLPKLAGIPSLKETTKDQLKEASEWYQGWNSIRKKIYQYCLDTTVQTACEDIADVRLQALDMYANQKLENRRAAASEAKSKKK